MSWWQNHNSVQSHVPIIILIIITKSTTLTMDLNWLGLARRVRSVHGFKDANDGCVVMFFQRHEVCDDGTELCFLFLMCHWYLVLQRKVVIYHNEVWAGF